MTNLRNTKRALLSSVVALFICFSMLLGTTFAWFTDSVTSSGNIIQSGNLDVELWQHYVDGTSVNITEDSAPIFGKADSTSANANTADTLWEPGKTQTVYLSIKNTGTLALKYKVALEVTNVTKNLTEVFEYIISPDATVNAPVTKNTLDWTTGKSVVSGINFATDTEVALAAGNEHFFALSVHMDELAGNEYRDGNITFNIRVLATQLTSESDSFDDQYDANAEYPNFNYVEIDWDNVEFPTAGLDIDIYKPNSDVSNPENKVGSMNFPRGSLDENATHVGGSIVETDTYEGGNIVISDGNVVRYFNISASGLKSDNDILVTVRVYIGEGYDPDTFAVHHYDEKLEEFTYDPYSGYVWFKSATFSPFAIEYDKDSVYSSPVVIRPVEGLPEKCPTADLVESTEYENVDLPWGSYGDWSPTAGLDSQLEAAFTFSCTQSLEEAKASPFANWYCDFVVVLNQDLGENQIFLGGNYGSFGWVGFHNGDLELAANTEIPLLGSVTSNPWTYAQVVQNVGTFICGVGDVDDALKGATFTVMLRLTNPENESEFYNVRTVEYTFQ